MTMIPQQSPPYLSQAADSLDARIAGGQQPRYISNPRIHDSDGDTVCFLPILSVLLIHIV